MGMVRSVVPGESKLIVKKNSIKIAMRKAKGQVRVRVRARVRVRVRVRVSPNPNPSPTPIPIPNPNPNPNQYGYDSWMDLTSKKARGEAAEQAADPSSGIMDLMRQMYDEGDDTMKKTIGEAMLKSRSGEAGKSPSSVPGMDDLDMGGF